MTRTRFGRIVPQLLQQYRERAQAGDWRECMRLARMIGNADRTLTAEAHYAYGYALEQLSEIDSAAPAYQMTLGQCRLYAKARRALDRLANWGWKSPSSNRSMPSAQSSRNGRGRKGTH